MSWSLNTSSPGRTDFFDFFNSAEAISKICVPLFSVCKKDSSSETETAKMRFLSDTNSGYCGLIAPIAATVSSDIIGSLVPSKRIFLMVRRIMRRNT